MAELHWRKKCKKLKLPLKFNSHNLFEIREVEKVQD